MAVTLYRLQESLSRSEIQEQVQTHRKMVLVIGDIEGDNLLFLTFLIIFNQREHQTTVFHIVLGLEVLLSPINQSLVFHFAGPFVRPYFL